MMVYSNEQRSDKRAVGHITLYDIFSLPSRGDHDSVGESCARTRPFDVRFNLYQREFWLCSPATSRQIDPYTGLVPYVRSRRHGRRGISSSPPRILYPLYGPRHLQHEILLLYSRPISSATLHSAAVDSSPAHILSFKTGLTFLAFLILSARSTSFIDRALSLAFSTALVVCRMR